MVIEHLFTDNPDGHSPQQDEKLGNMLFMSIDHLKKGDYTLTILEKEKEIKSIKIK